MFCFAEHSGQFQVCDLYITHKSTKKWLSNFGLIEEMMDLSCILLAVDTLDYLINEHACLNLVLSEHARLLDSREYQLNTNCKNCDISPWELILTHFTVGCCFKKMHLRITKFVDLLNLSKILARFYKSGLRNTIHGLW